MTNDMTTQDLTGEQAIATMQDVVAVGKKKLPQCEQSVKTINDSAVRKGNLSHMKGRNLLAEHVSGLNIPCRNIRITLDNGQVLTGRRWLNIRIGKLVDDAQYARANANLSNSVNTLVDVLDKYPVWVCEYALRWWPTGDNPDSGWFPKSGAIDRYAKEMMQSVNAADAKIGSFDRTLEAYDMTETANAIAEGNLPTLDAFDALCRDRGIVCDNTVLERVMPYSAGIKFLCWHMRQAILDAMGDAAPVQNEPLDVDAVVDELGQRAKDLEAKRKSKYGWQPIHKAGSAKTYMDGLKKRRAQVQK